MKVAIVAGEKSGDYLGSELITEFKKRYPQAEFVGLAGPLMQAAGAETLADMEKISIFGLDGLFSALGDILAIRKKLYEYFVVWQPDVFIGIDVPDFNLRLEYKLKQQGIPVVHYVSPTVWAWRGGRIKKIRRSINLMLALFPFEERYYQQHNTPVAYVGHSLAGEILNWQVDSSLQQQFAGGKLIAVLPGSRMSEVKRLAAVMIEASMELAKQYPKYQFVIPAASPKIRDYIERNIKFDPNIIKIIDGHSRDLLALCEMAILASGTAALEAALFAKPMVVMYKVSRLSSLVFKHTIQVEHFSMPNHLTDPPVVPELIQSEATVENLVREVRQLLDKPDVFANTQRALGEIAGSLSLPSSELACDAINILLAKHK